jgi:apolipoprotein N-acyltransferase
MVVFRAVESRRPVIRSTTTGISAVIGPDGSIVSSLGEGERGILRAEVPLTDEGLTLYTRIGDAFAILCALALAAGLGAAWRRPPTQT